VFRREIEVHWPESTAMDPPSPADPAALLPEC
jgi:hypothetical protein